MFQFSTYALLIISAMLPPSAAVVNCKLACQNCKRPGGSPAALAEVHCAMCQECKDRRRERLHYNQTLRLHQRGSIVRQLQAVKQASEECPTPPPCEESEELVPMSVDVTSVTKPTTTTPTTTTATTPRPTCPPITTCRKKRKPSCNMPCLPICTMPCPQAAPTPATTAPTTTGFYYMYVGIPKNLLKQD